MWEATYHRAFRYPGAAVAPQSAPAGLAEGAVEPAAGAASGEAAVRRREGRQADERAGEREHTSWRPRAVSGASATIDAASGDANFLAYACSRLFII